MDILLIGEIKSFMNMFDKLSDDDTLNLIRALHTCYHMMTVNNQNLVTDKISFIKLLIKDPIKRAKLETYMDIITNS